MDANVRCYICTRTIMKNASKCTKCCNFYCHVCAMDLVWYHRCVKCEYHGYAELRMGDVICDNCFRGGKTYYVDENPGFPQRHSKIGPYCFNCSLKSIKEGEYYPGEFIIELVKKCDYQIQEIENLRSGNPNTHK